MEYIFNQERFIGRFRIDFRGEEDADSLIIGMSCLKVCILKIKKFDKVHFYDFVLALFTKMGVTVDTDENKKHSSTLKTIDPRIFNAFVHLFTFIVSDNSKPLSKIYLESEPMISSLILCLNRTTPAKRISMVLAELMNAGNEHLAGVYYVYYLMVG